MSQPVQKSQSTNPLDAIEQAASIVKLMRESGASRTEILTRLVTIAESLSGPETTVSILVLDEEGLLRNGASPKLPADYLAAIDRIKPNANLGTCASAAATGKIVYTPDFLADEKWGELRQLPMGLGYVGAWSVPIKSSNGTVLGTFGTYFRQKRYPTKLELESFQTLADAAALAFTESTNQPLCDQNRSAFKPTK